MRQVVSASLLSVTLALLAAQAAAATGREVMNKLREQENHARNWTDRSQHLTMRIFRRSGRPRIKEMKLYEKRYRGGEKKALVFFLAPAEIRGTGFLQWSSPESEDKQWLYLPQFKRLRRISPRAKNESFASSDFSYRDLEILNQLANWGEEQASASLAGEEEVGDTPCYVVALRPKNDIGYDKLLVWVSKSDYQVRKIVLQGSKPELNKVLLLKDFRVVDGISTSHWSEMRNLKKGTRTIVETREVRYNRSLRDDFFTQRTLERGER